MNAVFESGRERLAAAGAYCVIVSVHLSADTFAKVDRGVIYDDLWQLGNEYYKGVQRSLLRLNEFQQRLG